MTLHTAMNILSCSIISSTTIANSSMLMLKVWELTNLKVSDTLIFKNDKFYILFKKSHQSLTLPKKLCWNGV